MDISNSMLRKYADTFHQGSDLNVNDTPASNGLLSLSLLMIYHREKYNLNALAHDTTIQLIRETLASGVNLREVGSVPVVSISLFREPAQD